MKATFVERKMKNTRTRNWEAILKNLKNQIYKYHRIWERSGGEDVPYFYNERSNVSMLAVSAALKGYLILEEYVVQKRKLGPKKEKGNGRVDLWIGSKNLKFYEIIEAKQCWRFSGLKSALVKAKTDCFKNYSQDFEKKAAVAFCTPYLAIKKGSEEEIRKDQIKKIKNGIERIQNDIKYDVALFMFPKKFRAIQGKSRTKKYHFPGLVVLVKLLNKRK